MSYTVYASSEIDGVIQRQLDTIVEETLALLGRGKVDAMILTGGFGRGEGGVLPRGPSWRIVNDFDIIVLPKTSSRAGFLWFYRRNHGRLEELADRLAERLQIKQIDLAIKHRSYFENDCALRIENYETLEGHRVIYGTDDPCDLMPRWRARDLPLTEGSKLLRNRGLGLLLAHLYFDSTGEVPREHRENFFIEYNKARLAMGDSILLRRGEYECLYSRRLEAARLLTETGEWSKEILQGYKLALEWKLRPSEAVIQSSSSVADWTQLARTFERFFLRYEELRTGRPLKDWREYTSAQGTESRVSPRILLRDFLRHTGSPVHRLSLRQRQLGANFSLSIEVIGALLAAADQGPTGRVSLQWVCSRLGLRQTGIHHRDFRIAVIAVLQAIHPGGVVAGVLRRERPRPRGEPNERR